MRNYHKLSIALKYLRMIIILGTIVYIVNLSTNTIYSFIDKYNDISLYNMFDLKKFIMNTYVITFVTMLFVVFYFSRKSKEKAKDIFKNILSCLLFLPISALLNYNFMILGSLMNSFYLFVAVIIIVLFIGFLNGKIDKLYNCAVESKEVDEVNKKEKGDKKCKKKQI